MKRFPGGIAILAVMSILAGETASAQLAGNPVYAVTPRVGITLSGDYGRGLKVGDSKWTDYFGGRLTVGLPAVSFWVGGGQYDSRVRGADKEIAMGGGAAVNFLKAPTLPVALSLQVGGAMVPCGDDCTAINAVAGPVLKINVVGAVDIVHPWIMPRAHVTRFMIGGGYLDQIGFGGSAGFTVTLPFGLGFHGALDFSMFEETSSGAILAENRSPLVAGGGLHYAVKIPGFGVL